VSVSILAHSYGNAQFATDSVGRHHRTTPIVQVVLQIAVTDAEFERLEKLFVLHEIKRVEHIKAHL